jgi:hypothetical protein
VLREKGIETWGPNGTKVPVESLFNKLLRLNRSCICNYCYTLRPFEEYANGFSHAGCINPLIGMSRLRRIRYFAFDSTDWLDTKRPAERLARALDAIRLAPNIDVILLTKRIENFTSRLEAVLNRLEDKRPEAEDDVLFNWIADWVPGDGAKPPKNVWLGVSVEDQKRADERIPELLKTPAAVRFLSVEPLLEPIDLSKWLGQGGQL